MTEKSDGGEEVFPLLLELENVPIQARLQVSLVITFIALSSLRHVYESLREEHKSGFTPLGVLQERRKVLGTSGGKKEGGKKAVTKS